ncbi:MAG: alpha/beta hydrolase, partial [Spirochaetes bacterium]|nr:alpha/beta hydrolase [Spirochaetota bacterium]
LPSQPTPSPAPLVIFIHGHGGAYNFSNGSRSYELSIALKDRGIAVATADYRPSGDALLNTYDVKAYVRFFKAHAKEYNIDPQRIGVWGTSRGGHLAAMVATTGDVKELEGDVGGNTEYTSAVHCAVIYYPITDVFMQPQIPSWFLGSNDGDSTRLKELHATKSDPNNPLWKFVELGRKVNPIQYVSEQDPPVLIAVSAKDTVTPMTASWALYQKYIEKGLDATFCTWSQGSHGVVGVDIEAGTQDWIAKKLLVDLKK